MEKNGTTSKQKKGFSLKRIIWAIVFTFIISQVLSAFFGWTVVDPILQFITPSKVEICPYQFPQIHDGKNWIRVNIVNEGLSDVEAIDVEYKLCGMDNYAKGILHSGTLRKGESDFFEIESQLNFNCSYATDPVTIEFYEDSEMQCYVRINRTVSNVCNYCFLDIKLYEDSKLLESITYPYPFFEGGLDMRGEIASGCMSYEEGKDKELRHVEEKDIRILIMDPSIPCLRGEWNRTWCEENGYKFHSC